MNTKEFTVDEMPEWLCNILFETNKMSDREYIKDNKPKSVIPIDRCNAICKHLFELMPYSDAIKLDAMEEAYLEFECKEQYGAHIVSSREYILSINPFTYTGLTSITREDISPVKKTKKRLKD